MYLLKDLPPQAAQTEPWLERLQWWTTAITRHEIGTLDEPAERMAQWSIDEVQNLAVDIKLLVTIMRVPSLDPNEFRLQQRDVQGRTTVVRWRFVSREEAETLRTLAHTEARKGDANRLLKRGAMLHADVAMKHRLPSSRLHNADARPRPREDVTRMVSGSASSIARLIGTLRGLLDV